MEPKRGPSASFFGTVQPRAQRRRLVVAALLVAAAVIASLGYARLGGPATQGLPADAPPHGVQVFYLRDRADPHRLEAYDWKGDRRGSVKLPNWVPVSRLRPSPEGSGFMLDPSTPGDSAAYFDWAGRTLFETNDLAFVSQAWADDGVHVCLLADTGSGALIGTRTPGQPDRMVQTQLTSDYAVAACSLRTDTIILSASNRLAILGLSNGAVIRGPIESGPVEGPSIGAVVATADAAYFTLGGNGFDKGSVWKVSDLARVGSPVASFDASLQPIAFSGDDSLLVVSNGTSLQALEWRSGRVAWTYDQPADATGPVVARPDGGDFVVYGSDGAVLIHRDGRAVPIP